MIIMNPVPHCWGDPGHLKRKFCNVCRRRIEESIAVKCEVCEYTVHLECHDFSVADCKECATYREGRDLQAVVQSHHWREGNLPNNSKCNMCRKTCWSAECLSGMRCEWCGTTAHPLCHRALRPDCTFGCLGSIMLPPASVSIPRTDVPLETILGVVQSKRKETTISQTRESDESSAYKDKDRDEELIRVFDGNNAVKRKEYRTIVVPRISNRRQIIKVILRTIHVFDDPANYYIVDVFEPQMSPYISITAVNVHYLECVKLLLLGLSQFSARLRPLLGMRIYPSEKELPEYLPILTLTKPEGKRPSVLLRYRSPDPDAGTVKVYPGYLGDTAETCVNIAVTPDTSVEEIIHDAIEKFGLSPGDFNQYHLSEVTLDKGSVHERMMDDQECPWELMRTWAKRDMMRFYLRQKKKPTTSSNVALFVGNLTPNLSERQYENILLHTLAKRKSSHYLPAEAFYMLREAMFDDRQLLVLLLPKVKPDLIPDNIKGLELISSFRRLLNPYQVYDLDNGGPLPGLYVFRHIRDYKILVCGGDGTVGWVLQCLDNVGQDSECQSPPCAILPLGTGNDLARVLRWGAGYAGGEDPLNLLRDVMRQRRSGWTGTGTLVAGQVQGHWWLSCGRWCSTPMRSQRGQLAHPTTSSAATSEDNTAIFVMNNYFGIGLDADLCLDFHNAREEHPDRFNSRYVHDSTVHDHQQQLYCLYMTINSRDNVIRYMQAPQQGVYVKMGFRKMVTKKACKDLQGAIKMEVDGRAVEIPFRGGHYNT
ncbi:DGKQ [Cordylochernes scorpioides]|uniref:Diacylglycerol kinase n=1 Tax=Cordylochernes scorpioides TaxID=51811 RepID=A0ABY6JXX5_9ARAC|nr:DGKQ [Cordylochernes scorpioides]